MQIRKNNTSVFVMKQITQNKLPISHKPQTHAFNTHTFERKKERKRERKKSFIGRNKKDEMTLDEDAETTVDGARRENDSNGQNSHHDGKERYWCKKKDTQERADANNARAGVTTLFFASVRVASGVSSFSSSSRHSCFFFSRVIEDICRQPRRGKKRKL